MVRDNGMRESIHQFYFHLGYCDCYQRDLAEVREGIKKLKMS